MTLKDTINLAADQECSPPVYGLQKNLMVHAAKAPHTHLPP